MSEFDQFLILFTLQLMGCAFYFCTIGMAKTKAQTIKITIFSLIPSLLILSLAIRPL